ncbi:zinc finger CCCH domain-containing protein 10-like [Euwallacea fornicatus]|uniref:zinc finger CCCH domain-containing protein 10-like n=1 Tax=Euwallacea fornicatus TaxID=995702 RepID=UPI00338FD4CE
MSDTSEEICERQCTDKEGDNVCRDFVRGICDRKSCKYKHDNDIRPLNFCHDYQNNICPRLNCKFIHCTPEEVEAYKRTGEMSNQILAEATRKSQLPGTPPVCNQFKKGLCRRTHCKFRHVTREQEEQEILELIQNNIQRKHHSGIIHESHSVNESERIFPTAILRRNGPSYDDYQESGIPLAKRRLVVAEEMLNREIQLEADRNRNLFKGYFTGSPPLGVLGRVDARTLMLEEENNLLHKEVAQLKKQVQDLTATNEFLLDQNATLRVTNIQQNVPAVTLTNSAQPPQVIRTVTASVATVPVSLATVTTGTPVSGNPVSIAGCPTVSIASPAQILAPSQQILVTTNPGQLALTNASQQQQLLANTAQQLTVANVANVSPHSQQQQQLALAANTTQQLTVANVPPQQLTLANTNSQLLQSNLAATNQITAAINTSQAIAMSNNGASTQPMVSYPIMAQNLSHPLAH